MDACVGIALFICLVIIVIVGVGFKINTDCDIEHLKSKVEYLNVLYHNVDKRWGNMYDIVKMQQDEIKKLKEMIELKAEKKCCCGNCRFYYELNNQYSACLNINNNHPKRDSSIYADGKSITCVTIKGVKPNDCCKWYEPKEASDETD